MRASGPAIQPAKHPAPPSTHVVIVDAASQTSAAREVVAAVPGLTLIAHCSTVDDAEQVLQRTAVSGVLLLDLEHTGLQVGLQLAASANARYGFRSLLLGTPAGLDAPELGALQPDAVLGKLPKPVEVHALHSVLRSVQEGALLRHELETTRRVLAAHEADEEAAFELTGTAFATVDRHGRVLHMNLAAERMLGVAAAELRGKDLHVAFRDVRPGVDFAELRQAASGDSAALVGLRLGATFEANPLRLSLEIIIAPSPPGAGTLRLALRDRTQEELAQQRQRRTERLTLLGRLCASTAHTFSNTLQALGAHLYLLTRGEDGQRSLEDALELVHNSGDLTRALLEFAGTEDALVVDREVAPMVNEVVRLCQQALGSDLQIQFEDRAEGAWVGVSRAALHQVLLTLIVQARDAMPNGGALLLRLRNHPELLGWVELECIGEGTESTGGRVGTARASDTSWSPNLDTAAKLANNWGGGLILETRAGLPAIARVSIPTSPEGLGGRLPLNSPLAAEAKAGPILLVVDSGALRVSLGRLLTAAGYDVRHAANFQAAREALVHRDTPGLVLADSFFPGGNASGLLAFATRAELDVPFLVLAGGANEVALESSALLLKPVTPEVLLSAVRARVTPTRVSV